MNLEYLQLEWLEPYQTARGRNRLPTSLRREHETVYIFVVETGSHNVALAVLKLPT